jgi:transcriptional regulator of acetoin/glycerol metabolism
MAVSHIESRVFNASYPDEIVLAFHSRRQYLESPGRVCWPSASAGRSSWSVPRPASCCMPSAQRWWVDGAKSFSASMACNCWRLHQGGVGSLQTAKGEFFYKTLRAPQRSINVAPPRSVAKPAKTQPDLESLAGNNARYARALRMARQGLANELPVLLLGETGTGKEVIARALHRLAARRKALRGGQLRGHS